MLILEMGRKPQFLYISHWFICVDRDSVQQSKKVVLRIDFIYLRSLKVASRSSFIKQNKIWNIS